MKLLKLEISVINQSMIWGEKNYKISGKDFKRLECQLIKRLIKHNVFTKDLDCLGINQRMIKND